MYRVDVSTRLRKNSFTGGIFSGGLARRSFSEGGSPVRSWRTSQPTRPLEKAVAYFWRAVAFVIFDYVPPTNTPRTRW